MIERFPLRSTPVHGRATRAGIARRDIIVALVVVGLLVCVIVIRVLPSREDARRMACQHRQWAVVRAALDYEAAKGEFPGYRNLQATDATGTPRPTGWVFPLLAHLHSPQTRRALQSAGRDVRDAAADNDPAKRPEPPYFEMFAEYGPEGSDEKRGQRPTHAILELICPSGTAGKPPKTPNQSYWVVNAGMPDAPLRGNFPPDWPANGVFLDLFGRAERAKELSTSVAYIEKHDGAKNTLLLSENVDSGEWTDDAESKVGFLWRPDVEGDVPAPAGQILQINRRVGEGDGSLRFARPSSFHPGGVNVAFVSGRVQFLNEQINDLVYVRLMMTNSREPKFPGTDQLVPPPHRLVEEP
jgi:hypothetical protein